MAEIVKTHFPNVEEALLQNVMDVFYRIREIRDIRKKPSTSELIDWINVLEGVSIDKNCSPFEKKLLQNQIDELLLKKENELGDNYINKQMKLRIKDFNVYEDKRDDRIVIEKP